MIKPFLLILIVIPLSIFKSIHWIIYFTFDRTTRTVNVENALIELFSVNRNLSALKIKNILNQKYGKSLKTYNGKINVTEVYVVLNRLETQGKITSRWEGENSPRKKLFSLTTVN
jgi:Transcriptional regulator PadR-like family